MNISHFATKDYLTSLLKDTEEKIFEPLKMALSDYDYLFSVYSGEYNVYLNKYLFAINRLTFYTGVFIVINIGKLLDKKGDYSVRFLLEKMKNVYKDSDWKDIITVEEINQYLVRINNIEILYAKNKQIRDKFYAHLDKDHLTINFQDYSLSLEDFKSVINFSETLLKDIFTNLNINFMDHKLSNGELGNVYLKELTEFNKLKYFND